MWYLNPKKNGPAYFAPQSSEAEGLLLFPDEFLSEFYKEGKAAAGFVKIKVEDGAVISCKWDDKAYKQYGEPKEPEESAEVMPDEQAE